MTVLPSPRSSASSDRSTPPGGLGPVDGRLVETEQPDRDRRPDPARERRLLAKLDHQGSPLAPGASALLRRDFGKLGDELLHLHVLL